MGKRVIGTIKLRLRAGEASPDMTLAQALTRSRLNIDDFCTSFNSATRDLAKGTPVAVQVSVHNDGGFVVDIEPDLPRVRKYGGEAIAVLAARAGIAAYQRALASGTRLVMTSASGELVERQPDGSISVIKTLPAATPVRAGDVLRRIVRDSEPVSHE